MEALAYRIKARFPSLFRWIEKTARMVVYLRFGGRVQRAQADAGLQGTTQGKPAEIRPLEVQDTAALQQFLATLSDSHLTYFRPHGFSDPELERVIQSKAFLTYGLFADGQMIGYALLKISPTGSAYIGRLVSPDWTGIGLGQFLASYLYWQAGLAGLKPRSTISRHNLASLKSHQAVAEYKVVAKLPNDYLMIEFQTTEGPAPSLNL